LLSLTDSSGLDISFRKFPIKKYQKRKEDDINPSLIDLAEYQNRETKRNKDQKGLKNRLCDFCHVRREENRDGNKKERNQDVSGKGDAQGAFFVQDAHQEQKNINRNLVSVKYGPGENCENNRVQVIPGIEPKRTAVN
jgi:hypothetical protein